MGNCYGSKNGLNDLTNNFLNSNIIDKEYKIIIGTYIESKERKNLKSNTMISQGICVGCNGNNVINKIKFGMIHRYENKMVELYFDNNIKFVFVKNQNGGVKFVLTIDDLKIEKNMDSQIIKNIKSINNNSEYIDLILKIII